MAENNDAARCDYCGQYYPRSRAVLLWRFVETTDDGRCVWKAGVYCGEWCGRQDADVAVGS